MIPAPSNCCITCRPYQTAVFSIEGRPGIDADDGEEFFMYKYKARTAAQQHIQKVVVVGGGGAGAKEFAWVVTGGTVQTAISA
jgi:hypothetical protein